MRVRSALLSTAALCCLATSAFGQISSVAARKLGMDIAWQAQVQLPRINRGLVSSHLWAETTNPRRFTAVELDGNTIRVSADSLGRDGKPIGIEEAKKRAGELAARQLGKPDGFQVVEVTVPRIKLILVTSDGLVQALDAETGKLHWATPCGSSSAPAHPAQVSPAGVTVIHGEQLYLLDWETGKHRQARPLRYSTSNSVALCNDIAYVSDFTGRVEAYGLEREMAPWGYVMQGRSVGRTAHLSNHMFSAIASDAGLVYVFSGGEEPSIWIRYETTSPITGSLTSGNNAFYAGTSEGLISKITT